MQEQAFIDTLTKGVKSTENFMAKLTEYHGGPAKTEYILTTDIARALLENNYKVQVECLTNKFINPLISQKSTLTSNTNKSERFDIAVINDGLNPEVIIEVKIRIGGKLTKIKDDIKKITDVISAMKAPFASKIQAACVFQVHINSGKNDAELDQDTEKKKLVIKVTNKEKSLKNDLMNIEKLYPEFIFKFIPLQNKNGGIETTEKILEDIGHYSIGQPGHATRYYAILIKRMHSKKPKNTFQAMKKTGY